MTDPHPPAGKGLPSRVVLIGFMGCGKSTCGPLLAELLNYDFVDLDREVESLSGRSVAEIFRSEGEAAFRELEAAATRALAGRSRIVVAVGGGWMTTQGAAAPLPGSVHVWLSARPDTLLARTGGQRDARPLLDPEDPLASIRRLLRKRESCYARAEIRVDTDGRTPAEVAAEIARRLREGDWSETRFAG